MPVNKLNIIEKDIIHVNGNGITNGHKSSKDNIEKEIHVNGNGITNGHKSSKDNIEKEIHVNGNGITNGHKSSKDLKICTPSRTSWNIECSEYSKNSVNRIRDIIENLNFKPNPKKDMIQLTIGDPTVFGNLRTAPEVEEAMLTAIKNGKNNGYAHLQGLEMARKAIAEYASKHCYYQISPENVLVTNGCATALDYTILSLAKSGQNLLVPRPGYTITETQVAGFGVQIRFYNLLPERDWEIDLKHLESLIDENTAAVLINNPSNPCGSVYSKQHLEDVIAICERKYLPIIADEVYEHMVFPGKKHFPLINLSKNVPVIMCSGLTKRFLVPGWRTGWVIVHDPQKHLGDIMLSLRNLSGRQLGASCLTQGALPAILKNTPQSFFDNVMHVIYENAKLTFDILSKIPGINPIMASGAMYMMFGIDFEKYPAFKDDTEFVERLVSEQSVFCLPGECFVFPKYIRIVLTAPKEIIVEACDRIAEFCEKYYVERNSSSPNAEK